MTAFRKVLAYMQKIRAMLLHNACANATSWPCMRQLTQSFSPSRRGWF